MKIKQKLTFFIALVMSIVSFLLPSTTISVSAETEVHSEYMPNIQDDTGTITPEIKNLLWAKFAEVYPDVDLSSFTLVYSKETTELYGGTDTFWFDVYYKNFFVYNAAPSIPSTTFVDPISFDGEPFVYIFSEEFVEYCFSLDFTGILTKEDAIQNIDYESYHDYYPRLSENNLISADLLIMDMYGHPLALSYRLLYECLSDSHVVFFVDAYTGEVLAEERDFDYGYETTTTDVTAITTESTTTTAIFTDTVTETTNNTDVSTTTTTSTDTITETTNNTDISTTTTTTSIDTATETTNNTGVSTTTTISIDTITETTINIDIPITITTTNYRNITEDDFVDWAKNDYKDKTGIMPANAVLVENSDGDYEITLTDETGNVLDVYTVDPATAIGTNQSDEEVNLPQTGVYSMRNWLIFFGGALMIGFGLFMIKRSGVIRIKKS